MKVAFTGTGATGKTTTAVLVAPRLGLQALPSPARAEYNKRGVTEAVIMTMPPEAKFELQVAISEAKFAQELENENFIADRTSLCNLAYALMYSPELMTETVTRVWVTKTLVSLTRLDHVFFFPMDQFILEEKDGFRNDSFSHHYKHSLMIEGFLRRHEVPCWLMPPGSKEERAEFVYRRVTGNIRPSIALDF